ncbi:hypothetical protein F4604DRAFT_1680592 [Suillus subluteus]|nr:hypothetical protein F4604DRAFT_1680592 [Suillus subluteus]
MQHDCNIWLHLHVSKPFALSAMTRAHFPPPVSMAFSLIETTATTVLLPTPALPVSILKMKPKPKEKDELKTMKAKPIRCNLVQNPSMFGPKLPCPQATPSHLPCILLSSPVAVSLASSVTASLTFVMSAIPSTEGHWFTCLQQSGQCIVRYTKCSPSSSARQCEQFVGYMASKTISHLDDAIWHFQLVLALCPLAHPHQPAALTNLVWTRLKTLTLLYMYSISTVVAMS